MLLAAGKGKRFTGDAPKALAPIEGQPLITLPIRTIVGLGFVNELILVVNAQLRRPIEDAISRLSRGIRQAGIRFILCEGGQTRSQSVQSGLAKVSSDYVLIHDASRPFASPELFERVLAALEPEVGAVPVVQPVDSLLLVHSQTHVKEYLDRDEVRLAQTPQGFVTSDYREARERVRDRAPAFKDDASLFIAAGYRIVTVPGEETNIKVTYPRDLAVAHAALSRMKQEL